MREIELRGSKLIYIRRYPDYEEIDITPVFQWFKEFQQWKEAGQPSSLTLPSNN